MTSQKGSDHADRAALERARTVSHLLDEAVRIPGTRFRIGLDPVAGVMPVSGDAVAAIASLYVVLKAAEIGVPFREVVLMVGRVLGDFAVGSIPLVGPIVDAGWKVNKRNVEVMEGYVDDESVASRARSTQL